MLEDGQTYEVLEVKHLHMGRGGSSVQTKIKNLVTGQVLAKNFKPSDKFEEAEIEKRKLKYLYSHRGENIFVDPQNPKERYPLQKEAEDIIKWLKPNTECEAVFLGEKIISIKPPIKIELLVKEAPPGVKGDRAQSGTKIVVLESDASISVPLFIEEGEKIIVNTETGEYAGRAKE